ncbi:hypothetical protein ACFWBH_33955 [Streptomyces sp. NPDC059999]|uniref:hypothetical protein n=1 Tax=unclassified Streptomyces TaxID=2593676 RepID=UPI00226EE9E9|nr:MULTISPECIES: hypothetical protein [unclassified Streptomyces]MCY0923459.1 hypothetical protein [Streptomyces sp. H27-G5]
MAPSSGPVPGSGPADSAAAPAAVTFKAGCPQCRARFELGAGALRLAIGGSRRTTFYSFTCPECGASVRKPAGERIVELLTGGGVSTLRSV